MLPEEAVAAIQNGDDKLRNEWIRQYEPFIVKTASRFAKRYIDPSRDDEYSVALSAFDEAITRFSPQAGSGFLPFASQVIQRRLIDHLRRERRHAAVVPYSALLGERSEEASALAVIEAREALTVYERDRMAEERRSEIEALTAELAAYGVTFADLSEQSPKHRDSREALLAIGARLARNPALFVMLMQKRQLPLKELQQAEKVSRKTLERNRKYLIAIALIAGGPYPLLRSYIMPSTDDKEEIAP